MAPTGISITALAEEKTIHPDFIRDEDERPKVHYNQFSNDIPVVSLTGIKESVGKRAETCRKIVSACKEWGIFQVVDHGIEPKLVNKMSSLAREFFSLPAKEKLRFDMSGGKKGGFTVSSHLQLRQIMNCNSVSAKKILFFHEGEAVQDWREMVTYFSYPMEAREYSQWPDKPEGWSAVTEAYSQQLLELGCTLLEVLSEAMGLEKDALSKACVNMDQKIVVNYYPKCPQPGLTLGLKRHTDPGMITLLLQDEVGGLQATRDGGNTWITVKPIQGAFAVNLGDYAHHLSNGMFKNADHQAVVNSKCSRLSIATFLNPALEAKVYPLKLEEGEKAMVDEPITFAEMYKRKMTNDLELARLKKLANMNKLNENRR